METFTIFGISLEMKLELVARGHLDTIYFLSLFFKANTNSNPTRCADEVFPPSITPPTRLESTDGHVPVWRLFCLSGHQQQNGSFFFPGPAASPVPRVWPSGGQEQHEETHSHPHWPQAVWMYSVSLQVWRSVQLQAASPEAPARVEYDAACSGKYGRWFFPDVGENWLMENKLRIIWAVIFSQSRGKLIDGKKFRRIWAVIFSQSYWC